MQDVSAPAESLDVFIAEEMVHGNAPGLAISVIHEGAVVFQRGYGVADVKTRRPMTERTGVVIGSTTKAFTCTALLQLAEAGAIRLDDPIRQHIPSFRVADEDASARMTIRQAVTHNAGLPPTASDNGRLLFDDDDVPDANARYVADLASTELVAPLGSTWIYANDGFAIAGRIIEIVSGMTYEEYVQRHILDPLGVTESGFSTELPVGIDLATPHDYDVDGLPYASFFPHNRARAAGGSTLVMSAQDAGKWLQAILDHGRVGTRRLLSEASFAEMVRPQVSIPRNVRGAGGSDTWYALGWTVGNIDGVDTLSHGGSTITMGSQFIVAPDARLAVAVVANSSTTVSEIVADAALRLFTGGKPVRRFPVVDRSFVPDRTLWPRFAGTYVPRTLQNTVPGPLPIKYVDGHLFATSYPGDERRRPGNIYAFPLSDSDFVLFGRGRTGGLASFSALSDPVEAVWHGVPIVKQEECSPS